jgi:hypothetical protein
MEKEITWVNFQDPEGIFQEMTRKAFFKKRPGRTVARKGPEGLLQEKAWNCACVPT